MMSIPHPTSLFIIEMIIQRDLHVVLKIRTVCEVYPQSREGTNYEFVCFKTDIIEMSLQFRFDLPVMVSSIVSRFSIKSFSL